MFRIETSLPADRVLGILGEVIARKDRATGSINGRRFTVQPRRGPYGVPVSVRGQVEVRGAGAVVVAWVMPHWMMIVGFIVWCWVGLVSVHAPIWFLALGMLLCWMDFEKQRQKVYDLLREVCAA